MVTSVPIRFRTTAVTSRTAWSNAAALAAEGLPKPLTLRTNWSTVERMVGKVRTVATDNAVKASRGVVFGVLALIAALVALPLVVILAVGLFREILGIWLSHGRAVWVSYMVMGSLLMIIGFFALRARHQKEEQPA